MEAAEYKGLWWIPGNDDDQVAGFMTFSPEEGVRLSLIGSTRAFTEFGSAGDREVIVGVTTDGKEITLVDCLPSNEVISWPGIPTQEFRATTALVGAHFPSVQALNFNKIAIRYSYLADWAGISGFRREIDTKDNQFTELRLTYVFPEDLMAEVDFGNLCLTYAFNTAGDLLRDAVLHQEVFIRAERNEPTPLDVWHSLAIGPLQNFLTLATARPNSIVNLTGFSPENAVTTSRGEREIPIEILFRQFYDQRERQRLIPHDMLFMLNEIQGRFDSVLRDWLRVAERLRAVCDSFFGVKYAPEMSLERQFLGIVQAAEAYHRTMIKNKDLPEDEHAKRYKEVVDSAPPQHREWLDDQLKYSNDLRLRRRLKELFNSTESIVTPLVGSRRQFVNKVVATRNFLTHLDEAAREDAATGEELFWLTKAVSTMVEACLLKDLGFPDAESEALFRRNRSYSFACSRRK
jgi:hypothetical protein